MADINLDGHNVKDFNREIREWSRRPGNVVVILPTPREQPNGQYIVLGVPEKFLEVLSRKRIAFRLN